MEKTYIDTDGRLHIIEENFTHLLPTGCELATQTQIDAANAPKVLTIQQQIAQLEASATPRRIREATLGTDNGWLKNLNAQIAALRVKVI